MWINTFNFIWFLLIDMIVVTKNDNGPCLRPRPIPPPPSPTKIPRCPLRLASVPAGVYGGENTSTQRENATATSSFRRHTLPIDLTEVTPSSPTSYTLTNEHQLSFNQ